MMFGSLGTGRRQLSLAPGQGARGLVESDPHAAGGRTPDGHPRHSLPKPRSLGQDELFYLNSTLVTAFSCGPASRYV
jgi:hypothetical protein